MSDGRRTTKKHYDDAQKTLNSLRKQELKAQELGDRELQSVLADARKSLGLPNALDVFKLQIDRP
jgi:hypothetical protein